ncbi:MAG: nitroreductase, partial [Firmicutes bacterium]|nr:nitroreductase [Bacillota bacterium]
PVSQEKLLRLLEAARLAPSANNRQPYRFIVITDPELRRRIAGEACHQEFLAEAPVLVLLVCEEGKEFDAAITLTYLTLAATDEGLATCWVGWFEREKVRQILGLPAGLALPILMPLGYAAESPPARPRKSLEELVEWR